MTKHSTGFVTVASLLLSGAIGLGGMGAAVSFYHSNEQFQEVMFSHPTQITATPSPTMNFMPAITTASDNQGIVQTEIYGGDE